MSQIADVVVVGAGVIGSACAYFLARAGQRVVLLEQQAVGSGSSTHATGSFSLLGADFKNEAHLQLAVASYHLTRELVPRIEELSGIQTLYQRRPGLRLALDEQEERYIREREPWQIRLVPDRWIDGDEVRRLEPRLSPNIRGASYEEENAQLDSGRFNLALATAAERLGAELVLREVEGLDLAGGRVQAVRHAGGSVACQNVVLAMGPWASLAGRWLGLPIPCRPLWGERLLLELDGPPLAALISSPKRGHMISRLDGRLSVGSTAGRDFDNQQDYVSALGEVDLETARPTQQALLELVQRAVDVLPSAADARVIQQLAGYRPLSPDGLPIIGPVPGVKGVFLATGHGTKGIHLAPITGRIIADLIQEVTVDRLFPLAPYSPGRFAGGAPPTSAIAPGPRVLED